MYHKKNNIVFMIFLFASIGPISSMLYLPSLPSIANTFHVSISLSQLTITLFVFGYSIARLFFSTMSDAFGRKALLVIGLVVSLIGSIICFSSETIIVLLIGRFLQGLGAGGSNILARIILRDTIPNNNLAKYLSYYSMVNISSLVFSPLLGGYIQYYAGWRASFITLIVLNGLALIICIKSLPETNLYRKTSKINLSIVVLNLRKLLTNQAFIFYAVLLILGYGNLMAWLTSGPILLQNILLLTPVQFGWCAVIIGAFSFSGAYLNSILVTKYGVLKMLKIGVLLLFCAGLVMLIPVSFNKLTITSIMLPAAIAAFGVSLIIPNAYAAGLIGCSDFVGIAVAILSFLQIMGGVLSSLIISITLGNNQVPLGLVFLISGILGIIIMFFLQKINSSL